MGYYIETPSNHAKAAHIISEHGAVSVTHDEARTAMDNPSLAVICVVDNRIFEAAAFCYNAGEFLEFSREDGRPRTWLTMDRAKAIELSGYRGR